MSLPFRGRDMLKLLSRFAPSGPQFFSLVGFLCMSSIPGLLVFVMLCFTGLSLWTTDVRYLQRLRLRLESVVDGEVQARACAQLDANRQNEIAAAELLARRHPEIGSDLMTLRAELLIPDPVHNQTECSFVDVRSQTWAFRPHLEDAHRAHAPNWWIRLHPMTSNTR